MMHGRARCAQAAVQFITSAHPDVTIHVGLIDAESSGQPVMPGMGDIADRLFGTDPEDATPISGDDGMDDA